MKRSLVPLALHAILLFVLSATAFAQKPAAPAPKPTPTPTLTEVIHDSTLTGKGTNASPLGLSDGAVIPSKISAPTAPTSGQQLTFNGSGFAWSTPSAGGGPIRVVDSLDHEVGVLISSLYATPSSDTVLRYIVNANVWLKFRVGQDGFIQVPPPSAFYESDDCTGTAYTSLGFGDVNHQLSADAYVSSGNVQYAARGYSLTLDFRSISDNGEPCRQVNFTPSSVTPLLSFPLSDLGLTQPFKLAR